jgi:hypothetical protein
MQPAEELMLRVADVCASMKLPYFVTGSVASMVYGEPRYTLDVDIVVEIPSWKAKEFCSHFGAPDFYVSEEAALTAAQNATSFNIIWVTQGVKADIMLFRDTPFNGSRLSRARPVRLESGREVMFSAPEDVILKKLEFYRDGGSDKHLRDIASMIRISGNEVDYVYIEHWAQRLSVLNEWGAIKSRLGLA